MESKTNVAPLIEDYLKELDLNARIDKVKLVQAELYKWIPVIPILFPQTHWGFGSDVTGVDLLLMSNSDQVWDLVGKSSFNSNPGSIIDRIVVTSIQDTTLVTSNTTDSSTNDTKESVSLVSFPFIYFLSFLIILQVYFWKYKK